MSRGAVGEAGARRAAARAAGWGGRRLGFDRAPRAFISSSSASRHFFELSSIASGSTDAAGPLPWKSASSPPSAAAAAADEASPAFGAAVPRLASRSSQDRYFKMSNGQSTDRQ